MSETPSTRRTGSAPDLPGQQPMTVGATARLLGLSVRTLHHWDHIGLVVPSTRTIAEYRLYSRHDIARLHRVLVYRELGMPLGRIREVLDDPEVDEAGHLASQRDLLTQRIVRLQQMVCAVDRMMEANDMNTPLTPQEQAQAFGSQWSDEYAAEAEERWGDSPEWDQAERVKAQMSEEDFARAREEIDALDERIATTMRRGVEPTSQEAMAVAEEHRTVAIGRWFDASHAQHSLIARGYTEDPRFTAYYDRREPGLAAWLRTAIEANARAHGVDVENASWS